MNSVVRPKTRSGWLRGWRTLGTLMPSELRAYLTHELGLSSHAVLREAVPLLLLDPEPVVRQSAAAVLEQIASRRRSLR